MKPNQTNKFDTFNWIKRILDSCETRSHYNVTNKLITNFEKMYDDFDLCINLKNHQMRVFNKLNNKIKVL